MNVETMVMNISMMWKGIFKDDIDIVVEDDDIIVINGSICLTKKKITIDRKTLSGVKSREVDGWELSVWVFSPPTQFEPEDINEDVISEYENPYDAVLGVLKAELEDKHSTYAEGYIS